MYLFLFRGSSLRYTYLLDPHTPLLVRYILQQLWITHSKAFEEYLWELEHAQIVNPNAKIIFNIFGTY